MWKLLLWVIAERIKELFVNIILILNVFCLIVWLALLISAINAKINKKEINDTVAILGFVICVLHFMERIILNYPSL